MALTAHDRHQHPERSSPATDRGELIVVSHRLPVRRNRDGHVERAPGGLVSALGPALRNRQATWFGHLDAGESEAALAADEGPTLQALELSQSESERAIAGFCNRTLWPALHRIVGNIEQDERWRASWDRRGRRTAECIASSAGQGAVVWAHDYHHFNVASHLRDRRPDLRLGMFCHTPISACGLRSLDGADSLARQLAAFDVIGTQTAPDAISMRGFLEGANASTSQPTIEAVPVGFDVQRWTSLRTDPVVQAIASRVGAQRGVLAFSADRVDYTKGLLHKLIAVDTLLASGAVSPDAFRLLQIAVPSRQNVPVYRFLLEELRTMAADMNAAHVRLDGLPVVDLRVEQLPPREMAGLARGSDVALVTPQRDGMNLVALEYAVLNGDRAAEVVLSEGAGAFAHIGPWCQRCDGVDIELTSTALLTAIDQVTAHREVSAKRSRERAAAASRLTQRRWATDFLTLLGA